MIRHLTTFAAGIALLLPATGANAHANLNNMHQLEPVAIVNVQKAPDAVKVTPRIGPELGMTLAFNKQVTLDLQAGFLTGLHASATLHVRF